MPELPPVPSDGDVNRGAVLAVPAILTTVVGLLLTVLRIYHRAFVIKTLRWDDFWNVFGLMFLIVAVVLCTYGTTHGVGRHIYFLITSDVMPQVIPALLYIRIGEFMVIFSTICTKLSITIFLLRIFNTRKRLIQVTWALTALNTAVSIVDAAIIFPSCTPVEKVWNQPVPGTCWSEDLISGIGIFQGVVAALADFYLATLPIIQLWNVKIKTTVKIGICTLMAMGYATGVFAIVRTVLVPSLFTQDITWALPNLFLFGVLEASVGIIACAAPVMRAFFVTSAQRSSSSKPAYDRYHLSSLHGTDRPQSLSRGPAGKFRLAAGGYESSCYRGGTDSITDPEEGHGILLTTNVGVRSESRHLSRGSPFAMQSEKRGDNEVWSSERESGESQMR